MAPQEERRSHLLPLQAERRERSETLVVREQTSAQAQGRMVAVLAMWMAAADASVCEADSSLGALIRHPFSYAWWRASP